MTRRPHPIRTCPHEGSPDRAGLFVFPCSLARRTAGAGRHRPSQDEGPRQEETGMFRIRKKQQAAPYDKTGKVPIIRSSICTGEQVAGFKDRTTGRFQELMLIRDDRDLQEFMQRYQVEAGEIEREW